MIKYMNIEYSIERAIIYEIHKPVHVEFSIVDLLLLPISFNISLSSCTFHQSKVQTRQ